MMLLAIDPGNIASGYCFVRNDYEPLEFGKIVNEDLMKIVMEGDFDVLAVEMVAHYGSGMPAGKTVFDTVRWIGRFEQEAYRQGKRFDLIFRIDEKIDLCKDSRAKDPNIRRALIDRFAHTESGKGTKKDPDFFYGFSADSWSAFAVACVWYDIHYGKYVSKVS